MKECEVVGFEYYDSDRAVFIDLQLSIYNDYVADNGLSSKHDQWGCRPPGRWNGGTLDTYNQQGSLGCHSLACDRQQEQLPSELLKITPQPPGESWFWVSGAWDLYTRKSLKWTPNPYSPVGSWYLEREIIRFSDDDLNQRPLNWVGP